MRPWVIDCTSIARLRPPDSVGNLKTVLWGSAGEEGMSRDSFLAVSAIARTHSEHTLSQHFAETHGHE